MADILFESENHKCVFFEQLTEGEMVPANQFLIIHNGKGILLDPGGHVVFPKLVDAIASHLPLSSLKYLFLSHQDPDIVASVNGWMMVTEAESYIGEIWRRFLAHFGVSENVMPRVKSIPDEGMILDLAGCPLMLIPAHFLHSVGNYQIYDPVSKILFSGDLGASAGEPYRFVEDFDQHIPYMQEFHKRYLPSSQACKLWADMIASLDIEMMVPQHGAVFKGEALVEKYIAWIRKLPVGMDVMQSYFKLPTK